MTWLRNQLIGKLTKSAVILAILVASFAWCWLFVLLSCYVCIFWSPASACSAQYSKAVLEHLHGLSSSRVVKELMSGHSPVWWQFSTEKSAAGSLWSCLGPAREEMSKGILFSGPSSLILDRRERRSLNAIFCCLNFSVKSPWEKTLDPYRAHVSCVGACKRWGIQMFTQAN